VFYSPSFFEKGCPQIDYVGPFKFLLKKRKTASINRILSIRIENIIELN
jgi:hypothetical protein